MKSPLLLLLLPCLLLVRAPAQTRVRLEAADGQPILADRWDPEGKVRGGIVLLHMYRSNRLAWRPLAPRLAAQGLRVIAIDMRGHGGSEKDAKGQPVAITREATADPASNPFLKMHQDAKAAIDHLVAQDTPARAIAVIGASVGCSVALHTTSLHPESVAAVVLMTPGTNYLGVPSETHAAKVKQAPVLILSSEEEADRGARQLAGIMKRDGVTLKIVPGSRIHGTRMFGQVPTIEADIIEWLTGALSRSERTSIPLDKTTVLDGELGETEGLKATWLTAPLPRGGEAKIRLSRNRRQIMIGIQVPERCLSRNCFTIYVDGAGEGAPSPTEKCRRVRFQPKRRGTPFELAVGGAGGWEDAPEVSGVFGIGRTEKKRAWSGEIALSLSRFVEGETPRDIRIAFEITGSVPTNKTFLPDTPNVPNAPRTWLRARIAGLR